MTTTPTDTEIFDLRYHGENDGDFVRIIARALDGFWVTLQTHESAQTGDSVEGFLRWDPGNGDIVLDTDENEAICRISFSDVRTIVVF